mgnify:CR=1 FL=1
MEVDWQAFAVSCEVPDEKTTKGGCAQRIWRKTMSRVKFCKVCLTGALDGGGGTGNDGGPMGRTANADVGRTPERSDEGDFSNISRSSWSI